MKILKIKEGVYLLDKFCLIKNGNKLDIGGETLEFIFIS
jgi:flavorubredoxin